MKIAFFGTPDFTTQFLDKLVDGGMAPSLVVTAPDSAKGRGMTVTSPEPKVWADSHHIRCLQPDKLTDEVVASIASESWDLFVVIAYGKIMPESLISVPKYGTINVHYSLLPKYRGASPVETALLNGDTETGISIQSMRYKLDSGPIIAEKTITIVPNDTTPTLRQRMNDEALTMIIPAITALVDGTAHFIEQDEAAATNTKKYKKDDGYIDDTMSDIHKWHLYQALGDRGWIHTMVTHGGVPLRLKITKAHLEDGQFVIDEVIPENGKRQSYDTFVQH